MKESRAGDARDPCEISALILLTATGDPVPCRITDISERGARLVVDEAIVLPERFTVALPLLDDQYDHRAVELRWRQGVMSGVRFLHP